jgi:hypothetical protein
MAATAPARRLTIQARAAHKQQEHPENPNRNASAAHVMSSLHGVQSATPKMLRKSNGLGQGRGKVRVRAGYADKVAAT